MALILLASEGWQAESTPPGINSREKWELNSGSSDPKPTTPTINPTQGICTVCHDENEVCNEWNHVYHDGYNACNEWNHVYAMMGTKYAMSRTMYTMMVSKSAMSGSMYVMTGTKYAVSRTMYVMRVSNLP